ncbi:hypothetical protein ACFV97_02550 [Streptomyces sp. NPDC059913]|uniref:hypothetical protein n=1 Tax=unclassified Streptomyces TaxID=2593676 RepID=UPI0036650154
MTSSTPARVVAGRAPTHRTHHQEDHVTTPTANELRDRVRRAICEASGIDWDPDMLEPDEYGEHADAVLAVLPDWLAAADAAVGGPAVAEDTIGLCGYCGVPREGHHHGYVSTAAVLAVARQILGGQGPKGLTTGNADDPICGDEYDDEACELEPGHSGAHCAGTLCWSDTEPAPAARVGRCPVMLEGGGRCEKDADHRAGRWPDDPHTPEPTPAVTEETTR